MKSLPVCLSVNLSNITRNQKKKCLKMFFICTIVKKKYNSFEPCVDNDNDEDVVIISPSLNDN